MNSPFYRFCSFITTTLRQTEQRKLGLLLVLLAIVGADVKAQFYDVRTFGAVGDSTTNNTGFIQKAIDSCSRAGGTVYIPKGTFLTGTLILKSNVTLHLAAGAILLGQPDASFYPYQNSGIRFYGEDWAKQALIFCKNQQNVTIEGNGTIDGQGGKFVTNTLKKPDRYRNRPYLLWFAGCENVTVVGVSLRNSAFWMQHYLGCRQLRIDGIHIWNHSNKNNDMMDIDGCSQVTIANVTGDSDDDGITIKSTSPLVSEHITITNCVLSSHCSAIKFGTESVGGFRNISISNCVIKRSAQQQTIYGKPGGISGLAMEIVDGGVMEHITVNNLIIDGAEVPLFVRLGNRARKHIETADAPPIGKLRNVNISNVVVSGAGMTGCAISGIPGATIDNITLRNIQIEFAGGGVTADVSRKIDELVDSYPEATMFGNLPAYGFFVRHVTGLNMSGIRIACVKADQRPAMYLTDTRSFSVEDIDVDPATKTLAVVAGSEQGTITAKVHQFRLPDFLKIDAKSVNVKALLK